MYAELALKNYVLNLGT